MAHEGDTLGFPCGAGEYPVDPVGEKCLEFGATQHLFHHCFQKVISFWPAQPLPTVVVQKASESFPVFLQQPAQFGAAPVEPGFYGSFGDAENFSDLPVLHFLEIAQDDCFT